MGRTEWQKRAYDRYKAQGLCVNCGKPVESERAGKLLCATCAANGSNYERKRYERYKAEHKCVNCGKQDKNTLKGKTRCFNCAIKESECYIAWYKRNKAKKTARSGNSEAVNRKNA